MIKIQAETNISTDYGTFRLIAFSEDEKRLDTRKDFEVNAFHYQFL